MNKSTHREELERRLRELDEALQPFEDAGTTDHEVPFGIGEEWGRARRSLLQQKENIEARLDQIEPPLPTELLAPAWSPRRG
jgi:hypothetical protein